MELDPGSRAGSGALRRLARRALPVLLLLAQILLVHQSLTRNGKVRAIRVPDTASYLKLAQVKTVEGALTHYRTNGYALLLRLFGWRKLPGRELAIFFLGTLCLFAGVGAYGRSSWLGLAAASPLLYGDTLELLGRIQPDFVSCGFVLVAVGALLVSIARPRNVAAWVVLVLAVLAAYQCRPATLFVIGWLPVAGWALRALRERRLGGAALRWAAAVAAATVIPYLAFIGWRQARVGELGLVAFGGYNMSGLAASLIDEEMLSELEGEHRELATRIYRRRTLKGWTPYDPAAGSITWFEQYSPNIWQVSAPVAYARVRQEEAATPPGAAPRYVRLEVNERLGALSKDVIRRRPAKYLAWVRDANLYGWRQLGGSPWVVWPAAVLAVSSLALLVGRRRGIVPAAGEGSRVPEAAGLLLLGGSYFLAYVLLISLLSFPFSRYYYGTVLLLPSALCAAAAALWATALAGWRGRRAAAAALRV
ncbi:MAG: hypothetical protein OES32_12995 [Acidobacteriota bacterium]|nr:hypothetical protein [Acidobacteriota bacterium]MDH3524495.1 hypothetical protein [Acidobacteriota bacterium]